MKNSFIEQALWVLKTARKPTTEELVRMIKIVGIGMLILGSVGYMFQLIAYLLLG